MGGSLVLHKDKIKLSRRRGVCTISKITAGIREKQGKANQSKKGANRGIGLTEWFWGWRPGGGGGVQ